MDLAALRDLVIRCDDNNDYAPLEPALVAAFEALSNATQAWEILGIDGIADISYGDGNYPPGVLEALVRRALVLADAELMGAVVRLACYHPDLLDDGKVRSGQVLASLAEPLREALDGAAPRLQVQLLRALRVAKVLQEPDRNVLMALLDADDEEVVALAVVLASELEGSELPGLFERLQQHPAALVRLAAAVAATRLDGDLVVDSAEAVHQALFSPAPLPRWWAFRTLEELERTDGLALEVGEGPAHAPDPVVEALLAGEELENRAFAKLIRLLFPSGIDPLGVVAAELGPQQRAFLQKLRAAVDLQDFGLSRPQDVVELLAEEGPLWSLRDVASDGDSVRWPAVRVWKARVWDLLSHEAALTALTTPLEPRDLFSLACTRRRGVLLQRIGHRRDQSHHGRDRALLAAVFQAIDASDVDLAELVAAAMERARDHDAVALGMAACRVLADRQLELSEGGRFALAGLMDDLSRRTGLDDIVAQVPQQVRERLDQLLDE